MNNPLQLKISRAEFETTNFLTHNFDWEKPIRVKVAMSIFIDYKCKVCGIELMQTFVEFNKGSGSQYELNLYELEQKTCNELLMEHVIE